MKSLRIRHLGMILPLALGGCQMVGAAGSLVSSLLSFGVYLAAIAIPILLSYYLYHRQHL